MVGRLPGFFVARYELCFYTVISRRNDEAGICVLSAATQWKVLCFPTGHPEEEGRRKDLISRLSFLGKYKVNSNTSMALR